MPDTEQRAGDSVFFSNCKYGAGARIFSPDSSIVSQKKDTNSFIVFSLSPGSILVQPILLD